MTSARAGPEKGWQAAYCACSRTEASQPWGWALTQMKPLTRGEIIILLLHNPMEFALRMSSQIGFETLPQTTRPQESAASLPGKEEQDLAKASVTRLVLTQNQTGVGSAETETVAEDGIHFHILDLTHQGHIGGFGLHILQVGIGTYESAVHHQQRIDGLMYTRRSQGMATLGLGGADQREVVAKHLAHGAQLDQVSQLGAGAMGIDVVDRAIARLPPGHLHTAHGSLAGRLHHVLTIGGGPITQDLTIDGGTAHQGMLELLDHQDTGTARDHKTIALGIVRTGRFRRPIVIGRAQGAHGIELECQAPVIVIGTAGKHHLLLTQLDLLDRRTNTMGAGGTGRSH